MAKKKQVEKSDWMDQKIQAINDSKMPEAQKHALLKEIGALPDKDGGITFAVYAKIKGISKERHKAMMSFPKAVGVEKASVEEWNEIFKNF